MAAGVCAGLAREQDPRRRVISLASSRPSPRGIHGTGRPAKRCCSGRAEVDVFQKYKKRDATLGERKVAFDTFWRVETTISPVRFHERIRNR